MATQYTLNFSDPSKTTTVVISGSTKNNYSTKKLNTNNKINPIVFSIAHVENHYWLGTDSNLISFSLTNDFNIALKSIF